MGKAQSMAALGALVLVAGLAAGTAARAAEGQHAEIARQQWSFAGPTGHYDKAQLRRGFQVYREVCAACHGLKLLHYRNLSEPGGPGFAPASVEAIAAEAQVATVDDAGEPTTRPAKAADRFVPPHANEAAAAAANNGAVPPDLSVIAKARTIERAGPWYLDPLHWVSDIATGYEEKGVDYIYALLNGYSDPPEGVALSPNMNYNKVYPGNQIAMAQPIQDGVVEYEDGSPNTQADLTRDVTAFLMWTAEPKLEERKQLGLQVMFYLVILSILLFLAKRAVWRDVKH